MAKASECPACLLRVQKQWAEDRGGSELEPQGSLKPLFPTRSGEFPSKQAVIATIIHGAKLLGLPVTSAAGAALWGKSSAVPL